VEEAQTGNLDLLVTLPVDKATLYEAQAFPFRGHTEYFRHLYPGRPLMLMVGEYLRVALVTEHLPLCEVVTRLSPEQVEAAVQQLAETLQIDFGIAGPRIAVLALNPHAGDGGLIGTEEERWLKPLVQRLSDTITVGGPYSADGFFGARLFHGVDGVLALYHDQGLIPFKLLEGWQGYQVTAGLPFIRTAPDHGVAYDKVGQAEVSIASLSAAVWEGLAIARRRHNTLLYMRPQVSRP
jgi:4-hydroxythreonine-4-phosphate dehydrogenase